jgi:hypothetical protein
MEPIRRRLLFQSAAFVGAVASHTTNGGIPLQFVRPLLPSMEEFLPSTAESLSICCSKVY